MGLSSMTRMERTGNSCRTKISRELVWRQMKRSFASAYRPKDRRLEWSPILSGSAVLPAFQLTMSGQAQGVVARQWAAQQVALHLVHLQGLERLQFGKGL